MLTFWFGCACALLFEPFGARAHCQLREEKTSRRDDWIGIHLSCQTFLHVAGTYSHFLYSLECVNITPSKRYCLAGPFHKIDSVPETNFLSLFFSSILYDSRDILLILEVGPIIASNYGRSCGCSLFDSHLVAYTYSIDSTGRQYASSAPTIPEDVPVCFRPAGAVVSPVR